MKLRFKNFASFAIIASISVTMLPGCTPKEDTTATTTVATETTAVTVAETTTTAAQAATAPLTAAALDGFWTTKTANSEVSYAFLDAGNTASYAVIDNGKPVGLIGKYEITGDSVTCKYDEMVVDSKTNKFAEDPITINLPIKLAADGSTWSMVTDSSKPASVFTKDANPKWSPDMMKAVATEILAPAQQDKLVGNWAADFDGDIAKYAFGADGKFVSLVSYTDTTGKKTEYKQFGTYKFDGHQLTTTIEKAAKDGADTPPLVKEEDFAISFNEDGSWNTVGKFPMKFVKDTASADWAK